MKILGIIGLGLITIFLGVKVFQFVAQENQLSQNLADIETRLTKAKADQTDLLAEQQYLANPLNLEKELRARFNYKRPGEKMIIIVPAQASGTTP